MNWRTFSNWAKHKQPALRVADYLGRGRGRFRLLDHVHRPSPAAHVPDLANWDDRELAACWIGHATVLLRVGGMNVLTDPVFSSRVGVGLGLMTGGPMRLTAPGQSGRTHQQRSFETAANSPSRRL